MNSEWNENASRTRGCLNQRATNRCSGTTAPSRAIRGSSGANRAKIAERPPSGAEDALLVDRAQRGEEAVDVGGVARREARDLLRSRSASA